MAFSVITFAPGLGDDGRARAQAGAPPCTATDAPYLDLLDRSGWEPIEQDDVTAGFSDITARELSAFEARTDRLRELMGETDFAERLAHRRARMAALGRGELRRTLFFARARPGRG